MWRALREAFPLLKWRRQVPVGPYYVDFLCFAERLIIEVDGGQHALATEQDAGRTAFLTREGNRVLRVWNNDVLANIDGVIADVARDIAASSHARRADA